jgi:phosphoglycerol transferase MdoB-like AlkP superfamily enzyme
MNGETSTLISRRPSASSRQEEALADQASAMGDQLSTRRLHAWLFWSSAWLAIALVAIKAFHLGFAGMPAREVGQRYLRALAAISYADVVFVVLFWSIARATLAGLGRWRTARLTLVVVFTASAALLCLYAVMNVVMFGLFGGFLTYPLLALVGDVRMLRSSVTTYLRPGFVAGLVCLPMAYVAVVWMSVRRVTRSPLGSSSSERRYLRPVVAGMLALAWIVIGAEAYASRWTTRSDRAIAENPEWVFLSSWWRAVRTGDMVEMSGRFDPGDLADFAPLGAAASIRAHVPAQPPLNVILIVLESVGARWTGLNSRVYDNTTPSLVAESAHALVFDDFYAHIGRSSNSLVAILLSNYPKLDFRDITDEYPKLPGTSLASVFQTRGYRTAFITPSDMSWASWSTFLEGRGFDEIRDEHQLACTEPLSSWGVEDRCMFEGILSYIAQDPARPFFIMSWTQQTHHPYEPTPGVPLLDLMREPVADEYDLNRYLNVLHETDKNLGRMLDGIRDAGLDQHTLVVVVGDHGQAFGFPHAGTYMQGRTIYEEDGHVPLMLWQPRIYESAMRSKTIGGHVDLAPTITALAGLPAAPEWQGRSLIDGKHVPRAYFYVAEDRFKLGVRENQWKYIYDLREAVEELYNLERDPNEQHNLAASEPALSTRLRRRLAAWTDANRRRYLQR